MSEGKVKRFFGAVLNYIIMGLVVLLLAAFFIGMFILKQWRWSCGG